MFVLLASQDKCNNSGRYFVSSWLERPTLKQVQKASSKYGKKFTNGRENGEDCWLDLVEVKNGQILKEDEELDIYRVAAVGERAIVTKKNGILLRGKTSVSFMEHSYIKTYFPEVAKRNEKNSIDVDNTSYWYLNFFIENKYLEDFKEMFEIITSEPKGWRLKPNYFVYKKKKYISLWLCKIFKERSMMVSRNFSEKYLTDYSYQCMDEVEVDGFNTPKDIIKSIEEEIGSTNIWCFSTKLNDHVDIYIKYSDLYLEYGYHEGFRLQPTFDVKLSLLSSYEPPEDFDYDFYDTWFTIHGDMVENNKYTTYSESLLAWLKGVVGVTIDNEEVFVKSLDEHFDKYNKILDKILTPYTQEKV